MFGFLVQAIVIVALPAMFVGGAAVFSWQQLSRPWLFVVLGLVVLYAAYVAIFYLLPSEAVGYTVMETGQATDSAKSYSVATHKGELNPSFIGQYIRHLLLLTVLAIPSLWFLIKLFAIKTA